MRLNIRMGLKSPSRVLHFTCNSSAKANQLRVRIVFRNFPYCSLPCCALLLRHRYPLRTFGTAHQVRKRAVHKILHIVRKGCQENSQGAGSFPPLKFSMFTPTKCFQQRELFSETPTAALHSWKYSLCHHCEIHLKQIWIFL